LAAVEKNPLHVGKMGEHECRHHYWAIRLLFPVTELMIFLAELPPAATAESAASAATVAGLQARTVPVNGVDPLQIQLGELMCGQLA